MYKRTTTLEPHCYVCTSVNSDDMQAGTGQGMSSPRWMLEGCMQNPRFDPTEHSYHRCMQQALEKAMQDLVFSPKGSDIQIEIEFLITAPNPSPGRTGHRGTDCVAADGDGRAALTDGPRGAAVSGDGRAARSARRPAAGSEL